MVVYFILLSFLPSSEPEQQEPTPEQKILQETEDEELDSISSFNKGSDSQDLVVKVSKLPVTL